eukprot:TRINITY_DN7767_c0_g1_i1.p2 TRINITY_DN7767_c0_g1~~TRINITY_DN7767_c0_g1_i1.p2  ORF type:complete len:128 (+),score=38.83 TRINITY_DN7767_c0_g1_i1:1217-1600(+)
MERPRNELQRQLEAEVNAVRAIQKDISKSHQLTQQYQLQLTENQMVEKELERLEDDAVVYKLIGPVLVRQDLLEAKANVAKRLEYIAAEMRRLESTLKSLDQKEAAKREEVMKIQRLQGAGSGSKSR